MTATASQVMDWVGSGLREGAAMLWLTWWPLVLGFTLSGLAQSLLPRDALRDRLGRTTAGSIARSSLLGTVSSSCSYAASAVSRALFSRGASWTNAVVFMVASTNLVVELGVVLYRLLGWQFLAAQIVGGVIMVAGLALATRFVFPAPRERALRERVAEDSAPPAGPTMSWRRRLRDRRYYARASRFTLGDVTMLWRELLAGFLVAGFVTVHVPARWWTDLFLTGHGWVTVVENVVLAPLLAVVSFVCSVGNVPLAAALWFHGVAFGGVISFIFADLVTIPLLLIYRRFYGTRNAARLFVLLWATMSSAGLLVDVAFRALHQIPLDRHPGVATGHFALGWTLALNVMATVLFALVAVAGRRADDGVARDPVCGMSVDTIGAVASRRRGAVTYYFCSPRCAERFDIAAAHDQDAVEPAGDP